MWGPRPGGVYPVRRSFGISSSRDAHLLIEKGHGLHQAHGCEQPAPESSEVDGSPEFGAAGAQMKLEQQAVLLKPVPPASGSPPVGPVAVCAVVTGAFVQPLFQDALLHRPVVPAARGDARGQTRTGAPTAGATVAADRHWIEGELPGSPVGFALVVSVLPKNLEAAMRAAWRPIRFRGFLDCLKVLLDRVDAGYNSFHGLGSLLCGLS